MFTLIAAIEGQAIITAIMGLIVFGLIAWLLYFLIDYVSVP